MVIHRRKLDLQLPAFVHGRQHHLGDVLVLTDAVGLDGSLVVSTILKLVKILRNVVGRNDLMVSFVIPAGEPFESFLEELRLAVVTGENAHLIVGVGRWSLGLVGVDVLS